MLMGGIPNQDPETEEELYELACCEVESILAARKQAKRFVRDHATSDRWAELAAKIL